MGVGDDPGDEDGVGHGAGGHGEHGDGGVGVVGGEGVAVEEKEGFERDEGGALVSFLDISILDWSKQENFLIYRIRCNPAAENQIK